MLPIMFITVMIVFMSHNVLADDGYYRSSEKQGYYWRNDPSTPVPEEEQTKKPAQPLEQLSIQDYTDEQLYKLHPKIYDRLIEDTKAAMVQSPTEENAANYMKLVDIARRRSLGVANLLAFTVQKNPQYNLERDIPLAQGAQIVKTRVEGKEQGDKIRASRRDFGLVFFYSTTCPYCAEESGVIKTFERRWGWEVEEIDVNASPAMASRFNVQTTPTLILIRRGVKDFLTLSVGVATLRELEERVYQGARYLNGEVRPEEFTLRESQRGGSHDVYQPLR